MIKTEVSPSADSECYICREDHQSRLIMPCSSCKLEVHQFCISMWITKCKISKGQARCAGCEKSLSYSEDQFIFVVNYMSSLLAEDRGLHLLCCFSASFVATMYNVLTLGVFCGTEHIEYLATQCCAGQILLIMIPFLLVAAWNHHPFTSTAVLVDVAATVSGSSFPLNLSNHDRSCVSVRGVSHLMFLRCTAFSLRCQSLSGLSAIISCVLAKQSWTMSLRVSRTDHPLLCLPWLLMSVKFSCPTTFKETLLGINGTTLSGGVHPTW